MGGTSTEEISEFIERVKKKFEPKSIILFGSRARGEGLKNSDYDLIVVSERFRGVPFLDRISMLYEIWDLDCDINVLAYTPEEFEEKREEIGVVKKAVEEGLTVG